MLPPVTFGRSALNSKHTVEKLPRCTCLPIGSKSVTAIAYIAGVPFPPREKTYETSFCAEDGASDECARPCFVELLGRRRRAVFVFYSVFEVSERDFGRVDVDMATELRGGLGRA